LFSIQNLQYKNVTTFCFWCKIKITKLRSSRCSMVVFFVLSGHKLYLLAKQLIRNQLHFRWACNWT
jgi:hypothetical protein